IKLAALLVDAAEKRAVQINGKKELAARARFDVLDGHRTTVPGATAFWGLSSPSFRPSKALSAAMLRLHAALRFLTHKPNILRECGRLSKIPLRSTVVIVRLLPLNARASPII